MTYHGFSLGQEVYFLAHVGTEQAPLFMCQGRITRLPTETNPNYRVQVDKVAIHSVDRIESTYQKSLKGRAFSKLPDSISARLNGIFAPKEWM